VSTEITTVTAEERANKERLQMIGDTIMKGATEVELRFFNEVCRKTGLDPFRRQIHAVQRWDNEANRKVWSYQTGIDGYRAIANRTGLYAGSDEPVFIPADEAAPSPTKASVTVWKIVHGQRVPFTASARWTEYVQTKRDGKPNSMWMKMPYGQLAKCAEALALRKAFPEEIGELRTDDEMHQADSEGSPANVPGRTPQVQTEIRPFTKEDPKPMQPAEPEPAAKAPQPSAAAAPQPQEAILVEAEVVDAPASTGLAVPTIIQQHTHGKWKAIIGNITGKALAEIRAKSIESGDPEEIAVVCASIYDEVQARLTSADKTELELADAACDSIPDIEFPADLWGNPQNYPSILKLCKSSTKK